MRRECRRADILAALSIRASNSPPNKLFSGLVSLGNTKSVNIVSDSEGYLGVINYFFGANPAIRSKVFVFLKRKKQKRFPLLSGLWQSCLTEVLYKYLKLFFDQHPGCRIVLFNFSHFFMRLRIRCITTVSYWIQITFIFF